MDDIVFLTYLNFLWFDGTHVDFLIDKLYPITLDFGSRIRDEYSMFLTKYGADVGDTDRWPIMAFLRIIYWKR